MLCCCFTPPFSSLQTSTSATRWAAPRPCARVAPARTRRAPTAAAARPATWPWPSPTTACPTQPRARRQRSSRGAAVGVLPAGNAASGPGGAEKGPQGCGCFRALRPLPSKAHNSLATFPGLSSRPLYPPPHRQPPLLPQQSPPRPGPRCTRHRATHRGGSQDAFPCHAAPAPPRTPQRLGSPPQGEHHCCTELAASLPRATGPALGRTAPAPQSCCPPSPGGTEAGGTPRGARPRRFPTPARAGWG